MKNDVDIVDMNVVKSKNRRFYASNMNYCLGYLNVYAIITDNDGDKLVTYM